jgi:DNA-binding protein Fis
MGNQNRAAAILDIERRRLYRKITLHGLRGLVDKRSAGDAV